MSDKPNKAHRVIEGNLVAGDAKFAIVASRFNEFLVSKLVEGSLDAIQRHGGDAGKATLVWVPGAFELPLVAKKLAESGNYDAVICLGAVVRGSTPHFDYVAGEAAKGIGAVSLQTGVPCIFGVVTTDNLEQAIERCGTKMGNKGFEAAVGAIEMVNLFRSL
ncbi:MAG: 6,7-dimethyl-8-ribityllumazine synthase [Planctomycetes bacterium]|nr:6,7-dimethyl-8-ribityllumazine synthase [Planctomycetota bacterium]MCA8945760.1 6,7-dimethyl-8-ribityllumazine synthase [Planctomycetota bacterium]